ncbi:phospholipid phosphatase 2-like isoform X2 [Mercenaria mercenaria]|uniref:phospholipid phosphatase 2-like isoform X2 n=1 Tax=Mercenaria mercenaria TaxID=6596 RepID=UPI001E1D94A5|nr:phospholipid phosphatase 2-like isoform X2 [Mercenaria mercenaria]
MKVHHKNWVYVLMNYVSLPVLYLFLYGKPYQTGFFCDDETLSYPSRPDTVSTPVLVAAGFSLSVLLVVLVEVLNCLDNKCRRPCQRASDILYCMKSYCVFLIGFLIQELVVDVVKNKMGVLRPNFFDVCKPQFNRTLCPGHIREYTCMGTDTDKELRSSRQSFPSGHSALSMYIAAYFCIYIQTRLWIRFSRLLKFFLQFGLVLIAILCGLGRIKDNKHHPYDVITGFILGITVAVFVHVMIGMKIVKTSVNKDRTTLQMLDKSPDCCCTCEQTSDLEQQTPSPLLQNEYLQETGRNSSSAKLVMLQNDERNMLVPVTSEII